MSGMDQWVVFFLFLSANMRLYLQLQVNLLLKTSADDGDSCNVFLVQKTIRIYLNNLRTPQKKNILKFIP